MTIGYQTLREIRRSHKRSMATVTMCLLCAGTWVWPFGVTALGTASPQKDSGLVVLYDFSASSGALIEDRSGVGQPLNLRIDNPKAVIRRPGSLTIRSSALIRSKQRAEKLYKSISRSGSLSVELWIQPAKINQSGPARLLTISKNANERNLTIGHDKDKLDARLRTTKTSQNGIPSLSSRAKAVTTKLTHIIYTRTRQGQVALYINGKLNQKKTVRGDLSNWDKTSHLALGNELTKDRPWLGTYRLVALYSRALTGSEVKRHFDSGVTGPKNVIAETKAEKNARHFEQRIAPLLAQHCFECHDSTTRKGRLNLTIRSAALAGGESGKVITPGKAAESLLWEIVESDEMPAKRDPLTPDQKMQLKDWINNGAAWPLESIDPAVYAHDGRSTDRWVQRLTISEYIESVRHTVGVDISKEAHSLIPPDLRADGFSNTAYNLNVDLKHVDAYSKLAETIVSQIDSEKFARQFSRSKKLTDDNMRPMIAAMGQFLLRGPLEEHEVVSYRGISTTVASAGGDFREAVSYIIQSMLQSPRFIYRMESQQGDGGYWAVSDYELASRLSYIIWGGPPDKALLKAADQGELSDSVRLNEHVSRMLKDSRTIDKSIHFIEEWLDLGRLQNLRPSPERFPNWNKQLAADMRAETVSFFRDLVWKQKRPLSDLLDAQFTYLTPELAKHYGLKPKSGNESVLYDLKSSDGRGGLLTHGSILTVGGDDASMVTRGLFVLKDLLRGIVKDPPPCVDTTPIPSKPGRTQREIAEGRIANKACGGCHSKFEPLAFGLAKFDGLGTYHDTDEHGNKLRDDGEILFPGAEKAVSYSSSEQLMSLLADSDRIRQSITWKLAQFSVGRPLTSDDARVVDAIHKAAHKEGGTYVNLLRAIVTSDLVLKTRTETTE